MKADCLHFQREPAALRSEAASGEGSYNPLRLADYFASPRGTCVMFALGFINLYVFFNLT